MPESRKAEEWATYCHAKSHWIAWSAGQGGAEKILCINCARAYSFQGVIEALGRMVPHLDAIQRKCEQYWNEPDLSDEEVHAALDLIFQEVAAIRALKDKL